MNISKGESKTSTYQSNGLLALMPVLFAFFVMGFCEAVGISSNYVKQDFGLTEVQANYLPSMVFLWFFIFSVPAGLLMNRIGRKNTVLLSMVFTIVAMIIPLVSYNFPMILFAFAMLGIGNTILQVSLNPLMASVVSSEVLTSRLTAGQFVKAISSFCAPLIAAFATTYYGNWKLMFPVFAVFSILSAAWLLLTPIAETRNTNKGTSFLKTFVLLSDKTILLFFLGILFIVGVDVGINTVSAKLLMSRCGLPLSEAGFATSLYFVFRTAGAFLGAFLLARIAPVKFFRITIIISAVALGLLLFAQTELFILSLIGIIGFACANVFSIIYGAAIQKNPAKANEISGLMIMGVSGGAVIPLFMGLLTDTLNSLAGALLVIGFCMLYLLILSFVLSL